MPKSKLLSIVCACSLVFQILASFMSPLAVSASAPDTSAPSALASLPLKAWLPVNTLKSAEAAPSAEFPALSEPSTVSAPQAVTLDLDILTSPWALLDSNSPTSLNYPHVLVIEAMISNTHEISAVNDVQVELDYEDDLGYWQLLEGEDAIRTISLGPHGAAYLYWFVQYPGTIGADHTYTVTVSGPEVDTVVQQKTVQTRSYLSTGNSGVIQTSAVVTVGVAFTVSVNYALGTNPVSLSFSPVGNVDFNPGAYRLLESYVQFYGGGGFEQTFTNQLYFATIPSTATNAVAVYTFIALTPNNTQLCPYTGVGYLNGQHKYDQFYCLSSKGTTIPIEGTLSFAMTKQASRSYIQQDESVAYTIYYTNSGALPLSYVWIWDDVPPGLGTITSPTPNTGTIVGEQVRWYVGRVPAGATGHVGFTFAVDGQGLDIADQTQGINHAFFGINPGELPATAALTGTRPITVMAPTVTVMKTDGESTVDAYAGLNVLTYTVRVTNSGSVPAMNVLITDVVPLSTTVGSVSPAPTQQDRTLTWTVPPIVADGGVFVITIPVTVDLAVPNGTVLTNTVDVKYENEVGYPFTVKSDVDTTTVRGPALAISKSAEPDAVLIGAGPSFITYTLHYTNSGPVAATGVVITDRVPMSTTFVAGSCVGCMTSTVGSDLVVSWIQSELGSSSSGSVTFAVEITDTEAKAIINGDNDGYGILSDQTSFVAGLPVTTPVSKEAAPFDGYTFQDLNGNGQMDTGEPGIPGVAVTLTQATAPYQTTDSNGYYSFTVESQGLISVSAALPDGYFRTTPGTVYTYSVLGVPTQTINFGYADAESSDFGVIYGTVYEDVNHDGLRAVEPGLAGIAVTSTLASVITPTTTDLFGRYVFSYTVDNAPVTITVGVIPPYVPTTPDEVSTLTQQDEDQEINFGLFDGIKITGQVFSDDNINGEKDPSEGALTASATVTARGASLATTDFFTFYLSAGSTPIEIVETDPAGYVSTNAIPRHSGVTREDENTLLIATPTAGTVYSGDFGDVLASGVVTISGYVWNDNGAGGGGVSDGVWNGTEPGLAGALVGISNGMTQTTDSTGQFTLYSVPTSQITLTDQTTGYVSTNAVPGAYGSKLDNDTLVFSGMTTAGMTSTYNLFGNVLPSATARITGTVFDDANQNGVLDTGENGISGVTVTLTMSRSTIVVLTGSGGYYEFAIAPGTDAWISSARPTAYFGGTPYPTTPESVLVHPTTGGAVYPNNNFGYSDDTSVSVIYGLVFDDKNSDGEQSVGEPGLAGVTVTLSLNGSTPITTVTQGNGLVTGTFSFVVDEAGIYGVHEYDPTGYRSTTPNTLNVNVPPTLGTSHLIGFGDTNNQDTASVYGTVFDDLNSNGQQDPDEPGLGGVMITVGELTATTKSEGQFTYGFILNLPGYYLVQEQDPAKPGFHSTTPDAVNIYAERAHSYIVDFGDTDASNYSVVTGIVFNDIDGNGVQGISEPGIEGVPVALVAANGSIMTHTQTASYGIYQLRTDQTGFIRVVETDLSNYHSTTPNTVTIDMAELGHVYRVNFGDNDSPYLTSFYGAVFDDRDADGLQALTEPVLSGVTVAITGPFDVGAPAPYTTNAWGQYTFLIENTGTYTVTEEGHLPGYVSTNAIPGHPAVTRVDADTLQVDVSPATLGVDLGDNLFGDAFPVQFSSAAYSVLEPAGPAFITVTIGAATDVTMTVDYATLDHTALAAEDYVATTGTLTFTPGLTELTFTVPITDDHLVEGTETLTLTLSNAQNATIFGNHPAVLSILDDETSVSLAKRTDAAEPDEDGDFVVSLSQAMPDPVTINYTVGGNATAGDDYTALPGAVEIPAGELTATITVAVQDDNLVEGDETVLLSLTTTNDARAIVDADNDTASLTIVDNDWATVSVTVGRHAEEPAVDGWFVIAFSNPVTQAVTIDYSVGGTASAGNDYQTLSGSVLVAANTVSVTIPVTVIDDLLIEGRETIVVTLADEIDNPRVSVGTSNSARLYIADDDSARVTVFVDQNAAEPSVNGRFVITMSKPATTSVTISYTVGGTASAGVDFVALSGVVVIPADTLSVTLDVVVQDDLLVEGDETVVVTLTESDSVFAGIYIPDTATLTIEDNDMADVSIAVLNAGAEPDVDGRFVISLTQLVATPVVISYTVGGSATEGDDFTALSGAVTIPAQELTATILVEVIDDNVYEGDETVQVTLDATDNPRVAVGTADNTATLTIADDDRPTVEFSQGDYIVPETAGSALITVTLSNESNLTTTVQYATTGGTATPDSDYMAASGVLTFAPAATLLTFTVPVLTDDLFEDDETVGLLLTDPLNADLGSTNPATLTIVDDSSGFAVITGTVFEDLNGNGGQDNGETGIPGVTVTLDGVITETTDGDGHYSLSTPTPGVHIVVETDLEGYFSTTSNEVHVDAALGNIYHVDFGDVRDEIVEFATIYGTVFEDANGNGAWDTDELGIYGVTISLDSNRTTTTNVYGSYTFSTTVAGWHTVVETDPEGYFSTTPNEVHISVAMDADYQVEFGDARGDISDFASIYGFVFEDANGNGVMDDTEGGIANVTVILDQSTMTTTDDLGRYSFSTQVTGVHSVVETDPEGYFSTTPNTVTLDVRSLQNDYQVDFGDAREDVADFASLYGTVFEDVNSNGVWDWEDGEVGIGGVAVTLDNTTMTTTDHLGRYTLSTQVAGSHTVVETDPEGYLSTTPNTVTLSVALGNGYQVDFGDILAPYCLCDPDAFEDDDATGQAKLLTEDGQQAHNFCDDATDWMVFTAEATNVYTITTSSWGRRADTVIALFDRDGQTLIAENDDYESTEDFSSRIVWTAPADGDYFIRVTNRAGLTGCLTDYEIWLEWQSFDFTTIYLPLVLRAYTAAMPLNTSQAIPLAPMGIISHMCPDSYEVDDTWQQAHPIEEDVLQIHSFDSDPALYTADKDFVIFSMDSGRAVTFTVTPVTNTIILPGMPMTLLELYDANGMGLDVTGTDHLVWEAPASGIYYLSASPLIGTFGCVEDAGYHLAMNISPSEGLSKLFLPLVMRNLAP